MTLLQLKALSESAAAQTLIANAQAAYFLANGKYKQTIKNVSALIEEQLETAIDEYVGQQGKGFIVRLFVRKNGFTYQKAVGFGSEQRSFDWIKITERESEK